MAKEDDKQEEKEIVPVGPGAEDPDKPVEDQKDTTEEDEEKKEDKSKEEDEDDDQEESKASGDEEDERVGHGDETPDEKRERRRTERHNRREREKRNRRELDFLRTRNETLERRFSEVEARQNQTDLTSIDQRIGQIKSQIKVADSLHAKAINKGAGEDAAEALSIRDDLKTQLGKLEEAKEELEKKPQKKEKPQSRQPEIDPADLQAAHRWAARNEWFDPTLVDEDSAIAKLVEDRLYSEGDLSPQDPEYWKELDKRLKKRIPHVFKNGKDEEDNDDREERSERKPAEKRRASGPKFSTGGRERSLGPNEVYISPERRAAMEEAGIWEDKETRERYLRSYQQYDKEARARR